MADFFNKSFDEILNDILTDYSNLDSNPDTSEGTMTYITAACEASALWGLYHYGDYIGRQIFPDTADTENLNHWGAIYQVERESDETDGDYLERVLNRIRKPPAGGNANDWANWCKTDDDGDRIETVTNLDADGNGYYADDVVVLTPPDVTPGTVTCVIVPNDESILGGAAMTELLGLIETNVELERPVTSSGFTISAMTETPYTFVVYVTGTDLDTSQISSNIEDYVNSLSPGETLYKSQMAAIALDAGAENVPNIVATPSDFDALGAIHPASTEAIRTSTVVISVSA